MGYGSEDVRVLFRSHPHCHIPYLHTTPPLTSTPLHPSPHHFLPATPSTAPSLSPFTVEKDHICWEVLVLSYVVIYSYNNSTPVYSVHTSMSDCSPELPPGSYSAGIVGNTSVVGTWVEIPGKWLGTWVEILGIVGTWVEIPGKWLGTWVEIPGKWVHGWRYLV